MPHLRLPRSGHCIRTFAAMVLTGFLVACGGSGGDSGVRPAAPGSSTVGAAARGALGESAAPAAVCGAADLSGAESFVHVSTSGSDVRGCGSTTAKACKTIQYGIDSCAATGCAVLVRHGLYPTTATIVLKNAVSVYGSCRFDGEPDRKYRTTIAASPEPGTPAVSASGIDTTTAFSGIVVLAKDETAGGTASIGMTVNNSKGLSLSYTTLAGGRGGDGTVGGTDPAAPGADGSTPNLDQFEPPLGGPGGPACGGSATVGAGGKGADLRVNANNHTACFIFCDCTPTGAASEKGKASGSVSGGNGALPGTNGARCDSQASGQIAGGGYTGGPGSTGACSTTGGTTSQDVWGSLTSSTWMSGVGGTGVTGAVGSGGGGGGAGGVCQHLLVDGDTAMYDGQAGGGGGGGGCGGTGGNGGGQGGASLPLILTSASSLATGTSQLSVVPGPGGRGGTGGQGGAGGPGGKGGGGFLVSYTMGSVCSRTLLFDNNRGYGGNGGTGGPGGPGGAGSGGAGGNGGPSLGVALSGKSVGPSAVAGVYPGLPGVGGAPGTGGTATAAGAGAECAGGNGAPGVGGGAGPFIDLDKPAPSVLTTGQDLVRGQSRTSANGAYALLLQTDGNLCLKTLPGLNYIWCSAENNLGTADRVAMQTDGNLCLSTGGNNTACSSTAPNPGAYLSVRDDGRAVIYSGSSTLWSIP